MRACQGIHVETCPFSVFHFHIGNLGICHFLHSPIFDKSPVHHISDEWSYSLYPFPSSGRTLLFHTVYPISLDISQVSTFLFTQYILLRAEYVPQTALATVPRSFIWYSQNLINIVTAILLMKKLKTLFTSPSGFCPINTHRISLTTLSPKSSPVLLSGSRKAFQHPDLCFKYLKGGLLNLLWKCNPLPNSRKCLLHYWNWLPSTEITGKGCYDWDT